jgi:hypothetical protein
VNQNKLSEDETTSTSNSPTDGNTFQLELQMWEEVEM